MEHIRRHIEAAWEDRSLLETAETRLAIRQAIGHLDTGTLRVAEKQQGVWQVNQWVKKAVIMYFPIQPMESTQAGPLEFYDKIPLKKITTRWVSVWYPMRLHVTAAMLQKASS